MWMRKPKGEITRLLIFALVISLVVSGCSLLNPPTPPEIPTPIPPPPSAIDFDSLALVTNPVSNSTLEVDPDIATLMNNVSRQQLLGYVQTLEGFGTRHTLSEPNRPDFGIGAARNWLFQEFQRVGGGRIDVRVQDFNMSFNGLTTNQQNIIATLPGNGTHPGVIALVAHYDTRRNDNTDGNSLAPGANDNASGVALLLEAARLLSSRTWNQDIIFIAFAAEEQETVGSFRYVQDAMLSGMIFDAVINIDTVGGRPGIPQFVRLYAPGPDTSPSSHLARTIQEIGDLYMPAFPIDLHKELDREGRYGDQREFINAGLSAVRMIESQEDPSLLNSATDTSEKIDYEYLAKITQLNVAVAGTLAGAPGRPATPTVTAMADPGAYILTWPTDPLAAGYAISFRPVEEYFFPDNLLYVNGEQAGNVAITGLDPSRSYFLSIAALDPNGRMSAFSAETLVQP
jgi:hypothetical protein